MAINLDDVRAFAAVARAAGFREASRVSGVSASSASEAVRRLEAELGVRLLNRTTRTVAPTEAGARLLDRLGPALTEIESALDAVKSSRDQPAGTVRLNVPTVAARVILPRIVPAFLAAYPNIRIEVTADDVLVDVLAAGCDAGIRYQETLEKDMIAIPSGALIPWEFERDGEVVKIEPTGPLVANLGSAADVLVAAAVAGGGILYLFEDWLRPHFESGALKPILERWWLRFSGAFLYYPSHRHMPAALRAFVDFIRNDRGSASTDRSPK